MGALIAIAEWSILAFGFLLLAAQYLAHEVGYWLGLRQKQREPAHGDGTALVVGALFGLLAFVLALTLSFASTRFNERREGTLAEANAIGTAWLRAAAIGQPRSDEIARLLEQYTQVRMAFVQAGVDPARINELNRQTNALQSVIGAMPRRSCARAPGRSRPG